MLRKCKNPSCLSPPFSTQKADLIRHKALLQKRHVRTAEGAKRQVLRGSQFHDTVDKSQSEAQLTQSVGMSPL